MNKVETNLPWLYGESSSEILGFVDEVSAIFFYSGLLGSMTYWDEAFPDWTMSYCTNNTINIDWNPDNNGEHIKNMCTYEGSITVPADPVKPGYTFTGWKLVE